MWTLYEGGSWAENTLIGRLRYLDRFYVYCDSKFGQHALDNAFGDKNAERLHEIFDSFYISLTSKNSFSSTDVSCWDTVSRFFHYFANHWAVSSQQWRSLQKAVPQPGTLRASNKGRVKFIRALPDTALKGLLAVAEPGAADNPFITPAIQVRNWLLVLLMLLCGLRRGETLLLTLDSLKQDLDMRSGEVRYWLNVTNTSEEDLAYVDIRTTRPSIKTPWSHREVPVSESFAELIVRYIGEYRTESTEHQFLFTSDTGEPLSAESVTKALRMYSLAMEPDTLKAFRQRANKKFISPHDLRHTCACVRYVAFLSDGDKEKAMERMRVFFGWSKNSDMPDTYARAAIQDDVKNSVAKTFDAMLDTYRVSR
ncbi:tyrosine-type recombinase/integrase [Massilia putida]|uniref:tyrosine-type recombinase/integrase n=1 Tax=Massilia putida TaxID=1141883 RepID=UPI0009517D30|nr:tyrosine-type recombinase/integrase [Massilia putida]